MRGSSCILRKVLEAFLEIWQEGLEGESRRSRGNLWNMYNMTRSLRTRESWAALVTFERCVRSIYAICMHKIADRFRHRWLFVKGLTFCSRMTLKTVSIRAPGFTPWTLVWRKMYILVHKFACNDGAMLIPSDYYLIDCHTIQPERPKKYEWFSFPKNRRHTF